ncbi:MAG TPA: hypothetical protein VKM72_25680 [Thermoanaerobaculia bacterium]|nr:hypothetical protein [Thermoanaerobaculia bacterium]
MHSLPQPDADELRAYARNAFDAGALAAGLTLPLPDEPFVPFWEERVAEARERGAFAVLREHMPQLRFPIRAGISDSASYQAATRRGTLPEEIAEATGLELKRPEILELALYASPAGRIPLIIARGRPEFVALVQAITHRNEPKPVPDSQGAIMIAGYNNWTRVRELRQRGEELRRELYQDRFILLSDGPYSAIPAADLGLPEREWRELSLVLRRDHECAHYLTRRIFGSMRNNLHDELIADYAGITAAIGHYRAAWFLRFLGLEGFPTYRAGGRLDLYRGDPPLSDGAFQQLHGMVREVAETVERFDAGRTDDPRERVLAVLALAVLGLEELAGAGGEERLRRTVEELRGRVG